MTSRISTTRKLLAVAALAIAGAVGFAITDAEARGGRGGGGGMHAGGGGGGFRGSAGPGAMSGSRSFAPMVRSHGAVQPRSIQPRGTYYRRPALGHRGGVETGPRATIRHNPGNVVVRDHRGQQQIVRPAPRLSPNIYGGRVPNVQIRDHRSNPSGWWRPQSANSTGPGRPW